MERELRTSSVAALALADEDLAVVIEDEGCDAVFALDSRCHDVLYLKRPKSDGDLILLLASTKLYNTSDEFTLSWNKNNRERRL